MNNRRHIQDYETDPTSYCREYRVLWEDDSQQLLEKGDTMWVRHKATGTAFRVRKHSIGMFRRILKCLP